MQYQGVRGTKDLFFTDVDKFNYIKKHTSILSKKYGFTEVITPILEFANVFSRHLGEGNEIVNKEMYLLKDRNNETLALRPEGTAAVVRMLLTNGLTHQLPLKFFYFGPMFRYERPQKGRQRQFFQFGVEHFGCNTPFSDALILLMAKDILDSLNITSYVLEINNLGTLEEQQNYAAQLINYLNKYKNDLSSDSQRRLDANPLRILDSKNEQDQKILQHAPKILNSLSKSSQEYFNEVLNYLSDMNIKYKLSSNIVRGLDYYTGLVFEFTTNELGSQSTILGGGRYNNLVKNMGGPNVPSIGFAAGVERLMLLLNNINYKPVTKVAILSLTRSANNYVSKLFNQLINLPNVVLEYIEEGSNLAKKLKKANKIQANIAIIIGEDEVKKNVVIVKNLLSGKQEIIDINNIDKLLSSLQSKLHM